MSKEAKIIYSPKFSWEIKQEGIEKTIEKWEIISGNLVLLENDGNGKLIMRITEKPKG